MNRIKSLLVSLSLIFIFGVLATSAQTTAFTYQGRLTDGVTAANGTYEMEFKLFDAVSGGAQIGSTITNNMVSVANGVFSVNLDFGSSPFTAGANRWLDIGVRKATDPPGFTLLTPRQQITSSPYSLRTLSATSADGLSASCVGCVTDAQINTVSGAKVTGTVANATTAGSVTGTVAIANGGTGATTATTARTNLGLGTLATLTPTGTANATTFLRGDNSWQTISSGVTGTGTNNYIPKFTTTGSTIGNSLIQDNGTGISFGQTTPSTLYQGYFYRQQLTVNGDGQATLFGYRTRDSQNDGISYAQIGANTAVNGYNFWGDVYTFGVGGWNYNDYSRTGGVLGADVNGSYWGSLGYRSSALLNYGVYGSAAYASGGGLTPTSDKQGIGGGFYGGMIGSWSRGEVMGQVNSGEMFASYNLGNVYTSGFSADMVSLKNSATNERAAAYTVTSPELKVYDNGSGQIDGDSVFIPFSKSYAGMLSGVPNVTVTAVGSPAQLYIKSIETDGFTVAVASGTAKVTFSWIAVGNRVDSNKSNLLPSELINGDFDSRMKEIMFNEGNKDESGKPIWWDGQKVRFDNAPEPVKAAKIEPKPNN